ncbi:MAG: peptidoglycan-binding protein [Planctomycetes bacterium]|nr:peptidoglycan-binding protein [Planctomycetota bacterium]
MTEGRTITASSGDSIPSLARRHGFFWQELWDLNPALQSAGRDPNVLMEGDEVFIPDLRERWESCATEQKHTFKRLGDPVKFRMNLKRLGKPRKNEPFVLQIGSEVIQSTTDGSGRLEVFVPGDASEALLSLNDGAEVYRIQISRLDPIETTTGVQQRLNNLGFACGSEDGESGNRTAGALRAFQEKYQVPVTGEICDATRAKLRELHP